MRSRELGTRISSTCPSGETRRRSVSLARRSTRHPLPVSRGDDVFAPSGAGLKTTRCLTEQCAVLGDYSAEAQRIMAEHPSSQGWTSVQSRWCGGRHPRSPGSRPMVLWRRRREYFHPETFAAYDVADDPPLWVAEQLSTSLCVTRRWAWGVRALGPLIASDLGLPWRIGAGELRPGLTVRLETSNGRWLWKLTGEPAPCCGGYLARWPD